jgi:hypothetical protein
VVAVALAAQAKQAIGVAAATAATVLGLEFQDHFSFMQAVAADTVRMVQNKVITYYHQQEIFRQADKAAAATAEDMYIVLEILTHKMAHQTLVVVVVELGAAAAAQ